MNKKWNEMTQAEKNHSIIGLVIGMISLIFVVLDVCNVWEYANLGWCISFALYLGIEAKMNWNKNRKMAIVELVTGLLLVGVNVAEMFL